MKYTSIAVVMLLDGASAIQRKHQYEALQLSREPLLSAPDRHTWAFGDAGKKGPGYPQDYPVPNFGMDKEIKSTQKSLSDTEAKLGVWNIKLKPDPEPKRDYFVPDYGVDHDIKVSLKNLDDQEKKHGPMNANTWSALQVEESLHQEREPLLSAPDRT